MEANSSCNARARWLIERADEIFNSSACDPVGQIAFSLVDWWDCYEIAKRELEELIAGVAGGS